MLEINHLSLRYGSKQVLQDVSFALRPHRLTALVGRNGSGKSTIFHCINQQLSYEGEIRLGGRNLAELPPRERAKAIAILPQTMPFPHITAREMVAFGRNPYLDFTGRLTEQDKQAVENALRDATALDLEARYVDSLSGGEKQRISLAMILAQNTPMVLLDEPTSHMDLCYEEAFLQLLRKLKNQQKKTVLVILHDLAQAVRYADDLIVLDEGRVVFAGSRDACLKLEIIEKTFRLRRFTFSENGKERIFFG